MSSGCKVPRLYRQGHGDRRNRANTRDLCQQLADGVGLVQCRQFAIQSRHALIQRFDMCGHLHKHRRGCGGDDAVSSQHAQQRHDVDCPLGSHHTEFCRMAAQGIDCLGALAHQHLTMPEDNDIGLLVGGLDRDRAHSRARGCLADRFGVVAVVLGPFDERLDVLRRDQPNPMTQPAQQAAPMMRAAACFQHHLGRVLLAETLRPGRA